MSEWLTFVKAYAEKNNISYKQALRDASLSYKTRNEVKPVVVETVKTKRKNTPKKLVENITLKEKITLLTQPNSLIGPKQKVKVLKQLNPK